MTDSDVEKSIEDVSRGPAVIMFLFSAWLALPSLWDAWNHDRYSRGGMWAFVIWLTTLLFLFYRGRGEKIMTSVFWLISAVLCCSLGGIFAVNLFYHMGLTLACVALFLPYLRSLCFLPIALTWMPATGWLVSRVMAGGLVGWERPLTVLVLCGVMVFGLTRNLKLKRGLSD